MNVDVSWLGAPPEQVVPLCSSVCVSRYVDRKKRRGREGMCGCTRGAPLGSTGV
jgi:hypothetical protein